MNGVASCLLGLVLAGPVASTPNLLGIEPPGLIPGETIEWTMRGHGLSEVDGVWIVGDGVKVEGLRAGSDERLHVRVRAAATATPGYRDVRVSGRSGVSGFQIIRVDRLPQRHEAEPNDTPDVANPMAIDSAVSGVLDERDVDVFAFEGRAGRALLIEVEARRLGSPIVAMARLLGPVGNPIALSRPIRDGSYDARITLVLPEDGTYHIEVHDALYRGGASAHYRVRIDCGAYATTVFPLGGPAGTTIDIRALGGNLDARRPWKLQLRLPDEPGAIVSLPPIPGGPDRPALSRRDDCRWVRDPRSTSQARVRFPTANPSRSRSERPSTDGSADLASSTGSSAVCRRTSRSR